MTISGELITLRDVLAETHTAIAAVDAELAESLSTGDAR
jgi:hypothetical protein